MKAIVYTKNGKPDVLPLEDGQGLHLESVLGNWRGIGHAGLAIRVHSILALKQFSHRNRLVQIHQAAGELGQLMIFIGISISNWLSVLAMTIPVTTGYLSRIKLEEVFMRE